MSLCDLNCCDLKWLQTKFEAINKKISDNKKLQDRINANIFKLIQESGIDVEKLLKNYYALNEEDYTKTLTSEDDINTLEPGTYKIVRTDMPQNAPDGIGLATYNGTLIKSQNYMALFEDTGFHFAAGIVLSDNVIWTWYHYISKTQIDLLYNYMKIRNYDKFNYSDVHDLTGFAAGVYTVDATVANLPVKTEGLLIIRQGVNKTDNYIVTFLPQNSNDVYKCYKNTDGSWSEWEQVAFMSDLPNLYEKAWLTDNCIDPFNFNTITTPMSLSYPPYSTGAPTKNRGFYAAINVRDNRLVEFIIESQSDDIYVRHYMNGLHSNWTKFAKISDIPNLSGYATETWVNQQIQDITGGSVTADWVKSNFLTIDRNNYSVIEANADLNTYIKPGTYTCPLDVTASTVINNPDRLAFTLLVIDSMTTNCKIQILITYLNNFYYRTLYNGKWEKWKRVVSDNELNDMATQTWVQSQNYLTEIPNEYTTNTEVTQAIAAALVGYATHAWVNSQGFAKEADIPSLNGYATQSWVNSQGFLTEIPDEYVTITELQAQNYATQSWVTDKSYQTSTQVNTAIRKALNGYATQSWVTQQKFAHESDIPSLSGYATQSWINSRNFATEEWVGQQGYQTVQQVNSLIDTATANLLTQEDLNTFNYATENWVLQTALIGYATENWVNTKLNDYLPKTQEMSLTTQGTFYGLQYQWARYGQIVEVFLVGNLTQEISNQLISDFCPAEPMGTLRVAIPGYDSKTNYAEFNGSGLKLIGTYANELYVNCHFTYLTNE